MFEATRTTRDLYLLEPTEGRTFTCQIDGEEIELVGVARIENLREVLTDAELRDLGLLDHHIAVSLYLVPSETGVSPDVEYGWHHGEYYPEDVVRDGKGVPIDPESVQTDGQTPTGERFDALVDEEHTEVAFADWEEAEEYVTDVIAGRMDAVAGMVGFYLDRAWNRVGTTGWDRLRSLTVDPEYDEIHESVKRATA